MAEDRAVRDALEQAQVKLKAAYKRIATLEGEREDLMQQVSQMRQGLFDAQSEMRAALSDGKRLAQVLSLVRSKHPTVFAETESIFVDSPSLNSAARSLGRELGRLVKRRR